MNSKDFAELGNSICEGLIEGIEGKENPMNKPSDFIIAEEVRKYWKNNLPQTVIVFFEQKYEDENDRQWEECAELVECEGSDCYESVIFLNDFWEGQTCVKNITVVPLEEVEEFYKNNKLQKQ